MQTPIVWAKFLDSKELSSLMSIYHNMNRLIEVINEMYPEGFVITDIKFINKDDIYHTRKYKSRKMNCVFRNSHLDKFNIICRFDFLKEIKPNIFYDCLVGLTHNKDSVQFELKDICESGTWPKVDDLHIEYLC